MLRNEFNQVIREVVKATGDITTVAGNGTYGYSGDNGPATAAELDYPAGVAIDAAGDLFIADMDNSAIREVVKATGDISTVAGNGIAGYSGDNGPATAAELSIPEGVAVDAFSQNTGCPAFSRRLVNVYASLNSCETRYPAGLATLAIVPGGGAASSGQSGCSPFRQRRQRRRCDTFPHDAPDRCRREPTNRRLRGLLAHRSFGGARRRAVL